MRNGGDRQTSKLVFLFIAAILFYLAFFGFNVQQAYNFTVQANASMFQALGF